jgi:hypothetical protein
MSRLYTNTRMTDEGLTSAAQSMLAIRAVLERVRDVPAVGWHVGLGTETFSKLTEAFATLSGEPVENVRKAFLPLHPANPDQARVKWIWCDEDLPDSDDVVLLADEFDNIWTGSIAGDGTETWITDDDGRVITNKIVAWTELPEPPRRES